MARLNSGSGGSGSSGLDASEFIDDNNIQLLKLLSTIVGAFVALVIGVWIEFIATIVQIHVWLINGVGDFLAALIGALLGTPAAVQVRAWETSFEATVSQPQLQPFILALEAIVLFAAFHGLRNRGVLP